MPSNTYGRQVVLPLTNKSGGSVIAGDVVIIDTANDAAFTTTTTSAYSGGVGVAQETIASNAVGRILLHGYAALVNVNASVTRGNYGKTHTVAKQATDAGASRIAGTFVQFLTGGTTPTGRVYNADFALTAGSGTLTTIEEVDASPTDSAVTKLVFPNGTLAIASHVATYTPAVASSAFLACAAYKSGSDAAIGTTTSSTSADVDATNLIVIFTVPASGKVLVRFSAMTAGQATGADYWQVRESSSVIIDGLVEQANALGRRRDCAFYISGLTPAASKTYKWGFRTTAASHSIYGGPTYGQAIMEVWAAP